MNCLFCGSPPPLSKEHLVSQPVSNAFGISRSLEISALEAFELVRRPVPLDQLQVRLPCSACNSTWMNDLEHGMYSVAKWVRAGSNGLTSDALRTLKRWLLKSYIVISALEGGIRQFPKDDGEFAFVPDATRAGQLCDGDDAAISKVSFCFARRRPASGNFAYFVGNPTVVPTGPRYANCRSAGAAVFVLGPLEMWIVVPLLTDQVTMPSTRRLVQHGDTFKSLPVVTGLPELSEAVVDNGEHDWPSIAKGLEEWARRQEPAA